MRAGVITSMVLALFLSSPSCALQSQAQSSTALPTAMPMPVQNSYLLEVDNCPEANACVMNIVGEDSVLGKQVAVMVGSYQVPSAHYYGCRLERWKGARAAKFLEETLRSAEFVVLTNAHKKTGNAYLSGTLLVDGKDITILMFKMLIAVPNGIKVDWCKNVGRKLEV